ncbi:hypothetical protein ACFQ10_39075 [Streptomyces indonesiensis]
MTATPEQHDVVTLLTADHHAVRDLFEGTAPPPTRSCGGSWSTG